MLSTRPTADAYKDHLLVENERKRMIDAHTEAQLLPFEAIAARRADDHEEYVHWINDRYYVCASKSPKGVGYVPLSPRVKRAPLSRCKGEKER